MDNINENIKLIKAMNLACKDSELKIKYSGLRGISEIIKNEYLSKITDADDKIFVENVLRKTLYVPSDIFFKRLEESFLLFSESIGNQPFYIYLPKHKFSSEHIFTIYLWDKIIRKKFIHFVNSESIISEGANIVIIDDCIYTGNNILSIIDETTDHNRNINFYIVVPFAALGGISQISSFKNKNLFSINFFIINKLLHYFPKYNKPGKHHSSKSLQNFLERFRLEYDMQVPIYFDHKVANNFSTFEPIYLQGVIPGKEDYGLLINYYPDTDVKNRIFDKYFKNIKFFQ